jgi:hypothetical protein
MVRLAEKAFDAAGPEGTLEAFNKALGRSVGRPTDREKGGFEQKDHGFEKARDHWFKKGTIGRGFSHLPCNRGTGLWRGAGDLLFRVVAPLKRAWRCGSGGPRP